MKLFGNLQKLEFGTIIYDVVDGGRGIVGIKDTDSVQVLWESVGIQRYTEHSFGFAFSLEKPKKKVKKEIVRYVSNRCLDDNNNNVESVGRTLSILQTSSFPNKITITYETEE